MVLFATLVPLIFTQCKFLKNAFFFLSKFIVFTIHCIPFPFCGESKDKVKFYFLVANTITI